MSVGVSEPIHHRYLNICMSSCIVIVVLTIEGYEINKDNIVTFVDFDVLVSYGSNVLLFVGHWYLWQELSSTVQ